VVSTIVYLFVFGFLLILEVAFDYFQKMRQRRLKRVGFIEGCWLERSTNLNMGSFVEIGYSADEGFKISGRVFDLEGNDLGWYEGWGRVKSDGQTLQYHYSGQLSGKEDSGSGDFCFHCAPLKNHAEEFDGSFYGGSSRILSQVKGERTENLPRGDASMKNNIKKLRVRKYLQAHCPRQ